jgi:hypothetical protein
MKNIVLSFQGFLLNQNTFIDLLRKNAKKKLNYLKEDKIFQKITKFKVLTIHYFE